MKKFHFDEEHHRFFIDGKRVPSVTNILTFEGLANYDFVKNRDAHMELGKFVHMATQFHDEGTLDPKSISKEVEPYLQAYIDFKADNNIKKKDIVSNEVPLYSEPLMFAGIPDRVIKMDEEFVVFDIKKGKPFPHTGLQLAGYKILWDVRQFRGKPLAKIRLRYALQLMPTGRYKTELYSGKSEDMTIFRSALNMVHYKLRKGLIKFKED